MGRRREHQLPAPLRTDDPVATLRNFGLRNTPSRVQVLVFFLNSERMHVTAEQAYDRLRAEGVDVSVSTVYRLVAELADVGILSRSHFDDAVSVYELRSDARHDHLVCLGCRRIDEFVDSKLEEAKDSIAASAGYTLANSQVKLYGYCPACRDNTRA